MPFGTFSAAAAVAPTFISTWLSHYTGKRPPKSKPTSELSYHEGLHVIRRFLYFASHHTVEDLQAFTSRSAPTPRWVKHANVVISPQFLVHAARLLIAELGPSGISRVGGERWWQWRDEQAAFMGEWIETRTDYNHRRNLGIRPRRVVLYIHGGAYYFGSVDTHRYQLQRHARKLKARVFARYRLAPQFPFPCGLQDCIAAYLFLLQLQKPEEILIGGDSSGAGMAISVLVTLRDQGLPLPAGALLLSPWVDLMHSFPSVSIGPENDFLPPYSFMHRPSTAWPPPSTEEIGVVRKSAKEILQHLNSPPVLDSGNLENHAIEGYFTQQAEAAATPGPLEYVPPPQPSKGEHYTDPEIPMTLEVDGRYVQVKDQIHMYATNHLLTHPLVSPALQPSLGGLPPMLIVTGGGEMLRDEQIYLAHKAANPEAYPPSDRILNTHDPTRRLISRYEPTYVQLQVWDDLCHIPTALSFTNPGKLVSRSIAQFGAWALSHTQDCSIDIRDNDDPPRKPRRGNRNSQPWTFPKLGEAEMGSSGRAGDDLPQFQNYMIRQRVDIHGNIYPLEPESSLPALQMSPSEVGEAKREPLYRWMTAKQIWDEKYARWKRKVLNQRVEEYLVGIEEMEPGEHPPPSSLAARRGISVREVRRPSRGSRAMAFWNRLSSKHDAKKLRKEAKESEKEVSAGGRPWSRGSWTDTERQNMAQARRASYTRTVTDTGQADHHERDIEVKSPVRRSSAEASSSRGGARSSPANAPEDTRHGQRVDFDSVNYYMYPDNAAPETSQRSDRESLVPPAIPERSASRRSPDGPPPIVRDADDVLTPVRGSSSSQVAWQTPRESMSYPSRYTTVNDLDQDGVLDQVDNNRLQVPRRGVPAMAPLGRQKDGGGADPDTSIKTLRDALGTVRPRGHGQDLGQKDAKGKDIAYDLHSNEQERVPSDTEPFPPYPRDENHNTSLSKAMSGYSSEYSVH